MVHSVKFLLLWLCCIFHCNCLLNPVTPSTDSSVVLSLISQLQTQINTLQSQVNSLQTHDSSQRLQLNECVSNITNLKAKTVTLEQTIQTLETRKNPVAFFVRLSKTLTNHHQSSILIFDHVQLNIGNGYDKNVGIFVAPQKGIYRFELVLSANVENTHVNIVRNGQALITVIADHYSDGLWGAGSGSIVVNLERGDKIWNQFSDTGNQEINGGTVTAFSGFMIEYM